MRGVLILFVLMMPLASAQASQVFRCVDGKGITTFSFTPCAPLPVVRTEAAKPTIRERLSRIEDLDKRIARLNVQFREMRLSHEAELMSLQDDDSKRELRAEFQSVSGELIETLSDLRQQRGQLVAGSVDQLTASEPQS